jgi:hypothetical protein
MAAKPDSTTTQPNFTTLALFSYDALEPDTRAYVQERTVEIRDLMVRAAQDIIAIGGKLTDVKARLQHGQFGAWIDREFQMSAVSAWNFMRVYTRFGNKSSIIEDLNFGPTVLYLLAAPSVPDEAVETVLERARAGEHITVADVKQAINDARPAPEPDMFGGEPVLLEDYETGRPIWVNEDGEIVGVDPLVRPEPDAVPIDEDTAQEVLTRPANFSSASNEWYTPAEYVNAAREVMGGIDLDPASNPLANETVRAARYYVQEDDGLAQTWYGRVFLNPPYGVTDGESNAGVWARKLIGEYRAGNVSEAVLLVNANTERKWFAPLWDFPICLTNHRIQFYTPDGVGAQPVDGNALVYLGSNLPRFVEVFSRFGEVVGSFTREVARV